MDKKRWEYLKALQPPPGRYMHVSARAWMQRHPLDTGPAQTMSLIPMIERPGHTFCENRSLAGNDGPKLRDISRRVRKLRREAA